MNFPCALFSNPRRLRRRATLLCALLPLAFAVPVQAVSEVSAITGQKKSYAYSWQQEMEQGAEADREVVEQMGLYENPELQQYVEAVGQRVLQASNFTGPSSPEIYRNTRFTFRIIDSPVVNAFALPGGFVYVTRGLLAHVQNEAQLGVVLGHEIAHVAARHSSQQAQKSKWAQLGVIAGAILGQKVFGDRAENIGSTILNAGGKAMETFLLKYSRDAENEADALGVGYATRAGYAAGESVRFFQALDRISASEGKSLPTWQSTHPDPGDRARHVSQLAATSPRNGNVAPVIGQDEFLRHVEGIVLGEDPREGFAQNGIFYHPTLRFEMPVAPGWTVENQRSAVLFAEPNGRAMMGLRLAPASGAREAASQFVQQSKIQVVANGDTQINGLPATVIIGQRESEDSGIVGVWNAFIEMDNRVYSLLGYAPQQSFEQVRPTFESVAAGFSPLRNIQATNVQPTILRIVRADRSAPFASFIPTSLPQNVTADAVATMNQVALNETIPSGRPLKVPDMAAQPPADSPAVRYPGNSPWSSSSTTPAPSSRYPQQPTYPDARYPQNGSSYPSANYPNSGYPTPSPGYPSSPYPGSNYPASNYPPSNHPQQNYPTYPSSNYPQPNYPSTNYPPSNYPSQGYPRNPNSPSGYPNSSGYPGAQSSYPQFPQPSGASSQSRYPQPPPDWPR